VSGAEATCSVRGSRFGRLNAPPLGWRNESVETDFHELRQDFSPTSAGEKQSRIRKLFLLSPKTPSRKVAKFCKLNLRKSPFTSEKVRFWEQKQVFFAPLQRGGFALRFLQ